MKQINTFTIKRKLPSLNDVISKNRSNKYVGAKFKSDIEESIGWDIKQALTIGSLKPVNGVCEIFIIWHESTKRRDVDNIQSAQKFILDALQQCGIIKNDSRKYVKQIHHEVVDDAKDFVVVNLLEV